LGAVPVSTVGYEKIRNWAFQYDEDERSFTEYLLAGQPEPPKYFAMMKHLNRVNRPLLVKVPQHSKLTKEQFLSAYKKEIKVIDTRNKADFAKGYIPGSINIQGNDSFSTWCGWLLNYHEQFLIVTDEGKIEDLTRKLMRIGLDNIYGYIDNVNELGIELQVADIIGIEELKSHLQKGDAQIVDVRGLTEYEGTHIDDAVHVFAGTIANNLDKISMNKPVIIHCQAGDRSTIAYSVLRRNGFDNIKNYSGGMKEWITSGGKVMKSENALSATL
jgi:hydroxyacylglutathione hydrolase